MIEKNIFYNGQIIPKYFQNEINILKNKNKFNNGNIIFNKTIQKIQLYKNNSFINILDSDDSGGGSSGGIEQKTAYISSAFSTNPSINNFNSFNDAFNHYEESGVVTGVTFLFLEGWDLSSNGENLTATNPIFINSTFEPLSPNTNNDPDYEDLLITFSAQNASITFLGCRFSRNIGINILSSNDSTLTNTKLNIYRSKIDMINIYSGFDFTTSTYKNSYISELEIIGCDITSIYLNGAYNTNTLDGKIGDVLVSHSRIFYLDSTSRKITFDTLINGEKSPYYIWASQIIFSGGLSKISADILIIDAFHIDNMDDIEGGMIEIYSEMSEFSINNFEFLLNGYSNANYKGIFCFNTHTITNEEERQFNLSIENFGSVNSLSLSNLPNTILTDTFKFWYSDNTTDIASTPILKNSNININFEKNNSENFFQEAEIFKEYMVDPLTQSNTLPLSGGIFSCLIKNSKINFTTINLPISLSDTQHSSNVLFDLLYDKNIITINKLILKFNNSLLSNPNNFIVYIPINGESFLNINEFEAILEKEDNDDILNLLFVNDNNIIIQKIIHNIYTSTGVSQETKIISSFISNKKIDILDFESYNTYNDLTHTIEIGSTTMNMMTNGSTANINGYIEYNNSDQNIRNKNCTLKLNTKNSLINLNRIINIDTVNNTTKNILIKSLEDETYKINLYGNGENVKLITGNSSTQTKSILLPVEIAENGLPYPSSIEKYQPVVDNSVSIDSFTFQSSNNQVRLTGSTLVLLDLKIGDELDISGATNPLNNGRYPITSINPGNYIEIYNPNITDSSNDETSSNAICDIYSKNFFYIRKFKKIINQYESEHLLFKTNLPEDYISESNIKIGITLVAPNGGDSSQTECTFDIKICPVNNYLLTKYQEIKTSDWSSIKSISIPIDTNNIAQNYIYNGKSNYFDMTNIEKNSTIWIDISSSTSTTLSKDIGLVSIEVYYE